MFTVSDNATIAIRMLVRKSGAPEGAGMRIATTPDRGSLELGVSPGPEPGDTVYDVGNDTPLFIAEDAGDLLADKTMDTRQDDEGRLQFVLEESAS